jgi:DNA-binding NtrC family response regulator
MSNILVIEDEAVVWSLLRRIITGMGHQVDLASDGSKGLELAGQGQYAVIVSDLHMPGEFSGMDLIRRLRAVKPQCPIVVVSGYPSAETLEECEKLGITDFLTKPFEMTFVQASIEKILKAKADAAPAPAKGGA